MILIVNADADMRALYRQSFRLAGRDVVEASDGRQALTAALLHPPTLVVTEIKLPFIDGCALCNIPRDRTSADVPILVVTGEARPIEIDRVRRMGSDSVLVKPASPDAVVSETRRLITDARKLRTRGRTTSAMGAGRAAQSKPPHTRLSKWFARFTTTTPEMPPPTLVCPLCDRPLTYEESYVGGVSARPPSSGTSTCAPDRAARSSTGIARASCDGFASAISHRGPQERARSRRDFIISRS